MKRAIMTALSAAIVLGGLAGGPPEASADNRSGQARSIEWRAKECRYQSLDKALWTDREERLTAECATLKTGVSFSMFWAIGECESHWNRFAYNPNGHAGLFQHDIGAYIARIHLYTPRAWDRELSTRWTNARGQIVMSARMMQAEGTGAWSCA